jgi:hypothetical protein
MDFTPVISLIFVPRRSLFSLLFTKPVNTTPSLRRMHSDFSCPQVSSELPKEQQDDQNQKDQSDSSAGIVSPALAVRPGGQCADKHKDQNDEKYCTHVIPPFLYLDRVPEYALRLAAREPHAVGVQGVGAPISLCSRNKVNGRLFHDEIILDGFDPFDVACDLARLIDGVLRINETAQLNDALAGFDANVK